MGSTVPFVWVVTECYPRPQSPGRCAFAHRQLASLAATGWAVKVLLPNGWFPPIVWRAAPAWRAAWREHVPEGWSLDGVPVEDLSYQNRVPSRLSQPADHQQRVTTALVRRIQHATVRPNLLLCQFALPYGPVIRMAAKAVSLPYAVYLRGDDVRVWPYRNNTSRQAFAGAVRDATIVLAVSRALVEEAEVLTDCRLTQAVVVPNGIDLLRFRPAASEVERNSARAAFGIRDHEIALLTVSSPLVSKGWHELLGAVGGLSPSPDSLVLVCALSSLRDEVDITAEAARLAPGVRVVIYRDLAPDNLARLYRAADVFALASRSEGMSNALLEAMASGLPCVATAVGGHAEAITHGADGLLVQAGMTDQLRDALESCVVSATRRFALGAAARTRVERIGDHARAGVRLGELLRTAICGSSASDQSQHHHCGGSPESRALLPTTGA